jgi:hypothetical protein
MKRTTKVRVRFDETYRRKGANVAEVIVRTEGNALTRDEANYSTTPQWIA